MRRIPAYGAKSQLLRESNNGGLISSFDIDSQSKVVSGIAGGSVGDSASLATLFNAVSHFIRCPSLAVESCLLRLRPEAGNYLRLQTQGLAIRLEVT